MTKTTIRNWIWRRIGLTCIAVASLSLGLVRLASADATEEIARLAGLMQWKPGTVVADIGAGDGRFSFAAAAKVGPTGRVYASEIDEKKLDELRAEVKRRNLSNVTVVTSRDTDTGLPAGCCDAIFLRRVYHHLTRPAEFDAKVVASLKNGGKLAIIDFAPRSGLDPVEGIPSNRGGHGIPERIVVEELIASGLQLEQEVKDWPDDSYCVVFVKK
jgi:ubiquinone/menaquinone biosynthesis C-methylase UbiE